jgi:hypothetical protein
VETTVKQHVPSIESVVNIE